LCATLKLLKFILNVTIWLIGVAQGGAKGAEAPPTPILEGLSPSTFRPPL